MCATRAASRYAIELVLIVLSTSHNRAPFGSSCQSPPCSSSARRRKVGSALRFGQGRQEFLSHQAQASRLHRSFVAKKLHAHRPPLPDPPGSPAGKTVSVLAQPILSSKILDAGEFLLIIGDDGVTANAR